MRTFVAIIGAITLAIVVSLVIAYNRPNTSTPEPEEQKSDTNKTADIPATKLMTFDEVKSGAVQVEMEIAGRGTFLLELYPKAAPKTVEHFVSLCKSGFYNGILVHRVEPGFVFQAGDPTSKSVDAAKLKGKTSNEVAEEFGLGKGGSGQSVPLEAKLPNSAMSVGLARSSDPNSGDSQFYVNLSSNSSLDGKYCSFGRVIGGQDLASKVQIGDKITRMTVK